MVDEELDMGEIGLSESLYDEGPESEENDFGSDLDGEEFDNDRFDDDEEDPEEDYDTFDDTDNF